MRLVAPMDDITRVQEYMSGVENAHPGLVPQNVVMGRLYDNVRTQWDDLLQRLNKGRNPSANDAEQLRIAISQLWDVPVDGADFRYAGAYHAARGAAVKAANDLRAALGAETKDAEAITEAKHALSQALGDLISNLSQIELRFSSRDATRSVLQ